MVIKSNASPNEQSSPFFKINENFCSEFETYISKKEGKVKGQYNAWSYLIYGKISAPKDWILMYKKSTFSSGNLLLSSKKQNLLTLAEWSTKSVGFNNFEFFIRRKGISDNVKIKFNKNLSKLPLGTDYIIESKKADSKLISNLTEILSSLFDTKEIYQIRCQNNQLKVELRSEKHHFNIFDKLLEL